jgi:hypothetical protein
MSRTAPAAKSVDRPGLTWRGTLPGVARLSMPKETILKFIGLPAMQKRTRCDCSGASSGRWKSI